MATGNQSHRRTGEGEHQCLFPSADSKVRGGQLAAENPLVRLATLQQRQINLTSLFDGKQIVII